MVAWAYGVGAEVCARSDDSAGGYFDLASLTKPLFTAQAVLTHLALDEPVALDWLPPAPGCVTVWSLLTHAARLPAELPAAGGRSDVHAWLAARVAEAADRPDWVTYSDPSYWLLGELVAARTGRPLHALFAATPAAERGGFRFGAAPAEPAVPAGPVDGGRQLPHDPAARRLGPSGHAGAFGTLDGVIAAVASWLDPRWLPAPLAEPALTCLTHATPGGHRSLAWTLAGDPFHVVAHDWPPTTLCHTGFTGVSVALDPVSGWWAVHLSNLVPIDRDATPALVARRHFYARAASGLREHDSRRHR
ncbi:serine hydrolase domain-containing protein [Jiangella anatolica]|nr:serine hydrolase domain-containing protein [Jiangella anatolica]